MTNNEILLFRKYMTGKGILNNFEYFYLHHRYNKKMDIDTYYEQVEPEDVIMSAFDMSNAGNTMFNFVYWKGINKGWLDKIELFRTTGSMACDELYIVCSNCKRTLPKSAFALKKNLVPHKHCKECESGEYNMKLREEKERITAEWRKIEREKELSMEREQALDYAATLDAKDNQQQSDQTPIQTEQPKTTKSMEQQNDYTFFDFTSSRNPSNVIRHGTFTITIHLNSRLISFGQKESKEIIDSGLTNLRIRLDNITGAIHFIFNKENGTTFRSAKGRVVVQNKELINFLLDKFNVAKKDVGRYVFNISDNIAKSKDYLTYLVTYTK